MNTLEQLDALLLTGAADLGPAFRSAQLAHVRGQQRLDGGFAGRQGGSDLYYTDFGLRLLVLLGGDDEAFSRVAAYLRALPPPTDLIELFGLLNCSRLLMSAEVLAPVDREAAAARLAAHALRAGGFARTPGGPLSAYATFLAALCAEMLELPCRRAEAAATGLRALQGESGGFRESAAPGPEQTNATAAAVTALNILGGLTEEAGLTAAHFLEGMQGPGGGLRAHAAAPVEDLLSTFTGLVALAGLPGGEATDLGGLARFVGALALPEGGFAATGQDPEGDLEYSYYGVATLALLRAILPRAA